MTYVLKLLGNRLDALKALYDQALAEDLPGVDLGAVFGAQCEVRDAMTVLRAEAEVKAKAEAKEKPRRARRASSPPPAGDEPETKPQTPVAKEKKRRGRPPKVRPDASAPPQDELPLERRDTEAPPPPSGNVSTFGTLDFEAGRDLEADRRAAAHEQNGGVS